MLILSHLEFLKLILPVDTGAFYDLRIVNEGIILRRRDFLMTKTGPT